MPVKVNFSDIEDFEAVPIGTYPVIVTSVEVRDSENSNYQYLNWELTITEGEYEGRKLWTVTSLNPKALWKLREALVAFGADLEGLADADGLELDETDYLDAECLVTVGHESYQGRQQARVQTFHAPETDPAPAKGKAAPSGRKTTPRVR